MGICQHVADHHFLCITHTHTARKQAEQEAAGAQGNGRTPTQGPAQAAPINAANGAGVNGAGVNGAPREKTVAEALAEMAAVCCRLLGVVNMLAAMGVQICLLHGSPSCVPLCLRLPPPSLLFLSTLPSPHVSPCVLPPYPQKEAAEDKALLQAPSTQAPASTAALQPQSTVNSSSQQQEEPTIPAEVDHADTQQQEVGDEVFVAAAAGEEDESEKEQQEQEQQEVISASEEEGTIVVDDVAAAIALNALPHVLSTKVMNAKSTQPWAGDSADQEGDEGEALVVGVQDAEGGSRGGGLLGGGLLGQLRTWAGVQDAMRAGAGSDDNGFAQAQGGVFAGVDTQEGVLYEELVVEEGEGEGDNKGGSGNGEEEQEEGPRLTLPPLAGGVCV